MKWECQYSAKLAGWVVEAIGSDGEVYVTQFYGPSAEARAKEYETLKNAVNGGVFFEILEDKGSTTLHINSSRFRVEVVAGIDIDDKMRTMHKDMMVMMLRKRVEEFAASIGLERHLDPYTVEQLILCSSASATKSQTDKSVNPPALCQSSESEPSAESATKPLVK